MRFWIFYAWLISFVGFAPLNAQSAEEGHSIEVTIDGFEGDEVYLANYFMDKQYIVDTSAYANGKAVFASDESLPEGTYLLVVPPDNDFAQLQITGDQRFTLRTNISDLSGAMQVEGDAENELFYDYLQFIAQMRPQADSLRALRADSTLDDALREEAGKSVEALDAKVKAYQTAIKTEHPNTITATILRGLEEPEMPEFEGTDEEKQQARYEFYKAHYFDNVDLADPRALRSTYLDQRVTFYFDKLVVPSPDSIIKEIDYVLTAMEPAEETYRYYVSKFLNDYATSKIVGMDAVYAHIGEAYYMSGKASWTDSTTIAKIAENVERVKPLLIGKPAPPFTVKGRTGEPLDLYEIEAPVTVLFFYDPGCGHCKKQTPIVVEFAKKYADKGVKVVSFCSLFHPEQDSCWSYVDEKGMADVMYNAADPYHRSKFKITYDISSTPQIYVLDAEKRIASKRIGAEQLDEVVGRMVEEVEKAKPVITLER